MANKVILDADDAQKYGLPAETAIPMADFEAAQERYRAVRKLEIAVEKFNTVKSQLSNRRRLLAEAEENYPVVLADLQGRVPEGFTLSNVDDLTAVSALVPVETNSTDSESETADESETPAKGRRSAA